jgi:hypothetical protein
MNKPKPPRGYIIYEGPSLLDGSPIVVVAIGKSGNVKTGNMVQTYIIRSDMSPLEASKSGNDFAICGNCPLRGIPTTDPKRKQAKDRPCYVNLGQGPTIVFKSYEQGKYPVAQGHDAIAARGKGQVVRLGTYGDPAAVPSYVWDSLLSQAERHTGYSHQSGVAGADFRADIFMQSADTLRSAEQAWAKGHRTFRIVADASEAIPGKEIPCPSPRVKCKDCGLCQGSKIAAKSIVIPGHGPGAAKIAA